MEEELSTIFSNLRLIWKDVIKGFLNLFRSILSIYTRIKPD